MAGRGHVQSDPIIYAIKTKENYLLALIMFALFMLAQPVRVV